MTKKEQSEKLREAYEILHLWMVFSADVRPSCMAGIEWMLILKEKTGKFLEST